MTNDRLADIQTNSMKLLLGFVFSALAAWGGWITTTTYNNNARILTLEQQLNQANYKLDLLLSNFGLTPKADK